MIEADDLVYVARTHCAKEDAMYLGKYFRVVKDGRPMQVADLECCGCECEYPPLRTKAVRLGEDLWFPAEWLRKVPPLKELETKEEVCHV